ncbi:hypothetical protein BDV06DRAFT_214003 [Aspergillus oleicola]
MGSISPVHQRHNMVVCLDAYLCPVPKFSFLHEYVEYENTVGEDLISERVKDVTIIITNRAPISARTISLCPRIELISLMAAGANIIDMDACREQKITVCNSPSGAASSVAEHAFALYFAVKRKIVDLHHAIGRGLGMEVLIAERRGTAEASLRPGRTAFETVLETATSRDMITETELRQMRRDATIVNVARGGVLNEDALIKALNDSWITSAATDVFALEPATAISTPLISKLPPNLTISPHIA